MIVKPGLSLFVEVDHAMVVTIIQIALIDLVHIQLVMGTTNV